MRGLQGLPQVWYARDVVTHALLEVQGVQVWRCPGFGTLITHRNPCPEDRHGAWTVTEPQSGARVSHGRSRADAQERAWQLMRVKGRDSFVTAIRDHVAKFGEANQLPMRARNV